MRHRQRGGSTAALRAATDLLDEPPRRKRAVGAARIAALLLLGAGGLGLYFGAPGDHAGAHPELPGAFVPGPEASPTLGAPAWLGIAAMAAGCLLLLLPGGKGSPQDPPMLGVRGSTTVVRLQPGVRARSTRARPHG
jgi:hypothetical protein